MPVTWQQLYADRTEGMRASDIREILKVTAQPDVISLAGGLPAPELFPVDEYRRAFEWVLEADGAQDVDPLELRRVVGLLEERCVEDSTGPWAGSPRPIARRCAPRWRS